MLAAVGAGFASVISLVYAGQYLCTLIQEVIVDD